MDMADHEQERAAASAAAAQLVTHAGEGFDRVVEEAGRLAGQYGPAAAWAMLTSRYTTEFECITPNQQRAVEMLIAAALRAAESA
ncbi:hypothetical protein GCM10014719_47030 [Planomonospora parontospora subsp. antibiotica]|nr:hypothetical protein GCM10014719_47030 [Planomonospora parontospora subsp. antibiotica]GII18264.1 hypothetical protein Ppa05_49900 [Planomonospora parontospora subsp. antibiotica]